MKKYTLIIFVLSFLIACKSDDSPAFSIDLHNGFFVTNEGPFQNGTGTITFISDNGEVTQEVFQKVNNKVLGNIVQSMTLYQDLALIVVNNSHKIVVADRYTLQEITVIEGDFIQNPRYIKVVNGKAFISNWGNPQDKTDDFISVVNLIDYTLVTKIPVGEGPEKMLIIGSKLYINLQGGFGFNNKLVILDTTNYTIINELEVGDVPVNIVKDSSNAVWVLCQGNPDYAMDYAQLPETAGKLIKLVNSQIVSVFDFDAPTIHPKNLTIDDDVLYYTILDKVFSLSVDETNLPSTPIQSLNGNYYTLKAHNNKLYATDPSVNFNTEGKLKVFSLESYTLLNEFPTGLIPGDIIFQN